MTERTSNGKPFAQNATGVIFVLVGGLFAVSIVQFLRGQQPKEAARALTSLVIELVARLGAPAALLFALGLAVLGSVLFLRSTVFAPLRPFVSLLLGSLGLALFLGAFGSGGSAGAWLPGLVSGFLGRLIGVLLGAALAWLSWTILFASVARPTRASSADVVQRVGLAARHDSASGVTPAEAALLGNETRPVARPVARREEPVRPSPTRPYPPTDVAAERSVARPAGPAARATMPAPAGATPMASPIESPVAPLTPLVPSWEGEGDEELAELEEDDEVEIPFEDAEALAPSALLIDAASIAAKDDEEAKEEELGELAELDDDGLDDDEEFDEELVEPDEEDEELEEDTLAALAEAFEAEEELEESAEIVAGTHAEREEAPAAAATPTASWEQVGLFDEEEDELEADVEVTPTKPAKVELTPTFDFSSSEAARHEHEPSAPEPEPEPAPVTLVPAAAPPRPAPAPRAAAPSPEFTLEPKAPAAPPKPAPVVAHETIAHEPGAHEPGAHEPGAHEPGVAHEDEQDAWSRLVFDAGCLILEQKRVAVSMLERRFAIDFDRACRVLDELQQAGLIGPYMGGRTRDILLTREEWLPHAPHAT